MSLPGLQTLLVITTCPDSSRSSQTSPVGGERNSHCPLLLLQALPTRTRIVCLSRPWSTCYLPTAEPRPGEVADTDPGDDDDYEDDD